MRELLFAVRGMFVLPGVWQSEEIAESSASRTIGSSTSCWRSPTRWIAWWSTGGGRRLVRVWQAADLALVVTTPELDSLMATYNSIKTLSAGLEPLPIATLVTMASSPAVAEDIHLRLARACLRFLGIPLRNAGYLAPDAEVLLATGMNELFSITSPNGIAAEQLRRLADVLAADVKLERAGGAKQ